MCMLSHLYYSMSTEFWWTHNAWEFSNIQSKFNVRMLCVQLSKQEYWVSRDAIHSVLTRISFKHKEKAMVL